MIHDQTGKSRFYYVFQLIMRHHALACDSTNGDATSTKRNGRPLWGRPICSIIRAPSIETTRAQTTVSAASGETIVLGGLITKNSAVISRSVPYLSDIPLIGDVFRYDSSINRRTELMIILTPQVIHSATDNERIKQAEMARMSWCTADVYDLHGDVDYSFPDEVTNLEEPTEVIYPDVQPRGNADIDEDDVNDERQQ